MPFRCGNLILGCLLALSAACRTRVPPGDDRIHWRHVSSSRGELPDPGGSHQQTGMLIANLDKGKAAGIVIAYRVKAPALVWIRHTESGWERFAIEPEFLTVEAGGAAYDIDSDGDPDIVFGEDSHGSRMWWWENPYPHFDPKVAWKRHSIKISGARQHHDQLFADLEGTGNPQLVFWNQGAKTVFLAPVPAAPREIEAWPAKAIFAGQAGDRVAGAARYPEGLDAFDVDGDGRVDLLAGNSWFKRLGDGRYMPVEIGVIGGRIRAGKFKPGRTAQVVIAPGDGTGPLRFYEAAGDPLLAPSWAGRDLLERDMVHGHTLEVADIDGDGNLDIFAAEMAKWTNQPDVVDHANAGAWILYGDGNGNFAVRTLVTGEDFHEGRIADFDGDGDLDIADKPYTWKAPRIDLWLNNGSGAVSAKSKLPFRRHLGMELWTYRRELAADLPGTLSAIRDLGFTDVETASFYNRPASEFRRLLDRAGLTCTSLISSYETLRTALPSVAEDAKAVGAKYVVVASIPRKGQLSADDVKQAAADFNEWGAQLKAKGLQFAYHPHGFEFVRTADGNLFDLLLAETRADRVVYELDVFWFAHGGADPAQYLEKHPGRFELVHLKDMAKGTPAGSPTGRAADEASVALGTGVIDWQRILAAAEKAGVKLYYIEDESPRAGVQVPQTLDFLKKLRF
jgi:sugar phosphate isomerase/epimerase